jgi:hypothetical protein
MLPPGVKEAQVLSQVVLHNGNGRRGGALWAEGRKTPSRVAWGSLLATHFPSPLHRLPIDFRNFTLGEFHRFGQFRSSLPISRFLRQHELV